MDIRRFTADMAFSPIAAPGEVGQAYILSGGDEQTRLALARTLAAAALCTDGGRRPCGRCAQCRKSLRGIHPDLIVPEKPADRAAFPVEQVRQICADAAVVPNDADAKVYLFRDASLLTPADQNAMLKTLEEPPGRVTFLLCVDNPGLMLETVRSRCVELDLPAPERGQEDDPYVAAFFDALAGGEEELVRFSFRADKLERQAFADMIARSRAEAVRRLALCAAGGDREQARRLNGAVDVLGKVTEYLEVNVGVVHAAGYLAAALAEM